MDADKPVHQDSPDILIDFSLTFHVEAIRLGGVLLTLHVALDVRTVLTYVVDVRQRCLIDLVDVGNDVALDPLVVHRELSR